MQTTVYGYLNPSNGDLSKGANGWMAQINFDILRIDQHSHNGIDSALLSSSSFVSTSVTAPASSWITSTGGTNLPASGYQQDVTVPAGVSEINNFMIKFLVSTAGTRVNQPLQLFYSRLTATTFRLYCNDNTLDVLCVFR
jgi:hypothetical protein